MLLRIIIIVLGVAMGMTTLSSPAQDRRPQLKAFAEKQVSELRKLRALAESRAIRQGLPIRRLLQGGRIAELQRYAHGRPLYFVTDNLDAADTVSTNEVWPGGGLGLLLDGSGQSLGIWDGGSVRASHQELNGRVTNFDGTGLSNHATHVAGTMIAEGVNADANGMSYAGSLTAYDFNGDEAEMAAEQLLPNPITISNHSYSFISGWIWDFFSDGLWVWFGDTAISQDEDYIFGFYDQSASDWDQIAFDSPNYLMVKSAGNDRNDNGPPPGTLHWQYNSAINNFQLSTETPPPDGGTTGYDSIAGGSASAKNILTVGAVDDIPGGYLSSGDVVMSSFSGWGPTDDGRIKPDLVANGIGLISSIASSDNAYASFSGTSMSAPNVSGSLGLLSQHTENLFSKTLRSATMKALVIHTASEAGFAQGPDYQHGWGLLNTASAAQLISDDAEAAHSQHILELDLNEGTTEVFEILSDGSGSLRATIAWTDPPGTPSGASLDPPVLMLVNDLDLRVVDPDNNTYQPWILDPGNPSAAAVTGDNVRDNVEQIQIDATIPGIYKVEITHKGILNGGSPQAVSLIVTGNIDAPISNLPTITSTPGLAATVGQAYEYDADNTVEAIGTPPITYSLVSGPAGFTVSPDGVVDWTPAVGQEAPQAVEIAASNTAGGTSQSFVIAVSPPSGGGTPIDFNAFPVESYGSQDISGSATIEDGGTTLRLVGNRWKKIDINYTITPNTVLEFDFRSSAEGELHGIGFDTDLHNSADEMFKLYGTQAWGIPTYDTYPGGGVTRHYVIPVGQYYIGAMPYLFFVMDHDVSTPTGESVFSNVRVYEDIGTPVAPTITSTPGQAATVGQAYEYDSDNIVEATGTQPITYSLVSGPAGFTVSPDGVVDWTPAAGQEGPQVVEIAASNTTGSTSQSFVIAVSPPSGGGTPIDFDAFPVESYGNQDISGSATIEDGGTTLRLVGNLWKKIDINYTITPNTVLEFDFRSSAEGELHGIGFDTDLRNSADEMFKLYGTQAWGIPTYDTYPGGGMTRHYVIPVGQYYSGAMPYLFFVMDHDVSTPTGESVFSNVRVYESTGTPIDFNAFLVESYGNQDISGSATIEDGGATLRLVGNRWKKIDINYTITPNTVLEFDFRSRVEGELHGIGFDTDLRNSADEMFKLYGTQTWGIPTYDTYPGGGVTRHYVIPVGQYYIGAMPYLFFVMDHDVSTPTGESVFSNVRVYDD